MYDHPGAPAGRCPFDTGPGRSVEALRRIGNGWEPHSRSPLGHFCVVTYEQAHQTGAFRGPGHMSRQSLPQGDSLPLGQDPGEPPVSLAERLDRDDGNCGHAVSVGRNMTTAGPVRWVSRDQEPADAESGLERSRTRRER